MAFILGTFGFGCAGVPVAPSTVKPIPARVEFASNGNPIEDCEPNVDVELSSPEVASLSKAMRQFTGNPIHQISKPDPSDPAPVGSVMVVTRVAGNCGTGQGAIWWAWRKDGKWLIQREKDRFVGWHAVS
jgi:hypothetical protein